MRKSIFPFNFRPVVLTFATEYRLLPKSTGVSFCGIHLPKYYRTKPCFPLTPPGVKFSIHIKFFHKNTSPFFQKYRKISVS